MLLNQSLVKACYNKSSLILYQIRTAKYARKPVGAPRAKSKRFYVREYVEKDKDEQEFIKPLINAYKTQMRSIYLLFQTEKKFMSESSQVGRQESEALKKRELALLEKNDNINQKIFSMQLEDERIQAEKAQRERERRIEEYLKQEEELGKLADDMVAKMKQKTFIDPQNLEFEIEKMLDSVVSYNKMIDLKAFDNFQSKKLVE